MSKYNIITIERQYASGGRVIGKKLAEKLGIPCYGKEILDITASRINIAPDSLEQVEETNMNSLIYSLAMASRIVSGVSDIISPADRLFCAESEVINELAQNGPCVIIGRCAARILDSRQDCLNVFIYADIQSRIDRAINEYGIDSNEAENVLRKFDKRRSSFYNANSNIKWEDKSGYHMFLDSGKLGVDLCSDIIANIFNQ